MAAGGAAALGVLVALTVRADSQVPYASPSLTAVDVTVGLAFVAAGALAGGPVLERVLLGAVGPAWLAGSFVPAARSLHQAVLAVALAVFPSGRGRGPAAWLLVGLAGVVGLQLLPQLGVAALFVAVAVVALARLRGDPVAAWYPAVAAVAVAAVLALLWWAAHMWTGSSFDPQLGLLGYELVLLPVAVAFPFGARAVAQARAKLADRLLSDGQLVGLDGLAAVLGDALGDGSLRVYRWDEQGAAWVDGQGRRAEGGEDRPWLFVDGPDGPLAVVAHRSPALDDAPTAAAVAGAVRLAVTHLRLQEEQQRRLRELEAARARLVAAADRERQRAAAALRGEVDVSLRAAQAELRSLRPAVLEPEAATALAVVVQELEAAAGEIADLVAGIPPADLGGGGCGRRSTPWPRRAPSPSPWWSPMMRPAIRRRRPHCSTSAVRRWPTRSSTRAPPGSPSPWSVWTAGSWRPSPTTAAAGRTRPARDCRDWRTGWRPGTAGSGWTVHPEPARR
jgi:hypothetical protein